MKKILFLGFEVFDESYNAAMKRSGFADLPLHYGRVPTWLSERMTRLGTSIVEAEGQIRL